MAPRRPSFGSQKYWDARFTSNSNPFEWLETSTALDPYLVAALKEILENEPEILHIGCGTSLLSFHLRAHVKDPGRIHNLDYSDVAIRVGRQREMDVYDVEQSQRRVDGSQDSAIAQEITSPRYMHWSAANLLSHSSLLQACKPSSYSIIVDKSTSDSIACSEDVHAPLPYPIGTATNTPVSSHVTESSEPIHPLHILAIHMALLTKPKARWISLSYSDDRYPFVRRPRRGPQTSLMQTGSERLDESDDSAGDDLDDIPQTVIDGGLPDPSTLWALDAKYEVEVPQEEVSNGSDGDGVTHRPRIVHWVYVLQRTDVEVFVRNQSD